MGDMFQQPILEVENPAVFAPVKAAIEATFAPPAVGRFLDKAERARLRIRDFDTLLPARPAGRGRQVRLRAIGKQRSRPDPRVVSAFSRAGRSGIAQEVFEGLRILLMHQVQSIQPREFTGKPTATRRNRSERATNGEGKV